MITSADLHSLTASLRGILSSGAQAAPSSVLLALSSTFAGTKEAPRASPLAPEPPLLSPPAPGPAPEGPREVARDVSPGFGAGSRRPAPEGRREHRISQQLAVTSAGSDLLALRHARLEELSRLAAACTACPLHSCRTQVAFGRGNPDSELMFVGEGPGQEEDRHGVPFVGPAGMLLDKIVGAMGFGRDEVYIGNIVKCRPPQNRTPLPVERAACLPFIAEQVALVEPRVIVCLGATAAQALLGVDSPVGRLRGRFHDYRGIPLLATYHPAYLLRTPEAKRQVWDDMKRVLGLLGRSVPGNG